VEKVPWKRFTEKHVRQHVDASEKAPGQHVDASENPNNPRKA
jgi:hypothetical protein